MTQEPPPSSVECGFLSLCSEDVECYGLLAQPFLSEPVAPRFSGLQGTGHEPLGHRLEAQLWCFLSSEEELCG